MWSQLSLLRKQSQVLTTRERRDLMACTKRDVGAESLIEDRRCVGQVEPMWWIVLRAKATWVDRPPADWSAAPAGRRRSRSTDRAVGLVDKRSRPARLELALPLCELLAEHIERLLDVAQLAPRCALAEGAAGKIEAGAR
jgi:hypothetical protein